MRIIKIFIYVDENIRIYKKIKVQQLSRQMFDLERNKLISLCLKFMGFLITLPSHNNMTFHYI